MKKLIIPVFFCILIVFTFLIPQEKEIREDVTVTNIEIPVRVFKDKTPVSGLKKSDFKLVVNGKVKEITGFYEENRVIKTDQSSFLVNEKPSKSRLFVLVFNVVSFHMDMMKGVDFFFDKIIKKDDRLMVLANDSLIREQKVLHPSAFKGELKKIIKTESKKAEIRLLKVLEELEGSLMKLKRELNSMKIQNRLTMTRIEKLERYLYKHLEYFKRYKREFLIPDLNKYYGFARYLDNKSEEKWVINFFQLEKFPKFKKISSFMKDVDQLLAKGFSSAEVSEQNIPAQKVQKLLWEIEREMNMADSFPVDQIKKMFLQVNTTFHTILMKSREISDSEHFDVKAISTDIENSLREITKATGGQLLLSNDLETSLKTVSERKDVFYILSYSPENEKEKNASIVIKTVDKSFTVRYNKDVYADYFKQFLERKRKEQKDIVLSGIGFDKSVLSFEISGFKRREIKNDKIGAVEIRIRMIDSMSETVFDQKKRITIKEKKSKISVTFNKLPKGEYSVIVNVSDLIGGSKFEDHKKIVVKR